MDWKTFLSVGQNPEAGHMTPGEVADFVREGIPAEELLFIWNEVVTQVRQGKIIQAIKAFRAKYGTSLLYSKMFIDAIRGGTNPPSIAEKSKEEQEAVQDHDRALIDGVAIIEDAVRMALLDARHDDKAFAALAGIHTQVVDLWRMLAGVTN